MKYKQRKEKIKQFDRIDNDSSDNLKVKDPDEDFDMDKIINGELEDEDFDEDEGFVNPFETDDDDDEINEEDSFDAFLESEKD